jgi:hypothetical protein
MNVMLGGILIRWSSLLLILCLSVFLLIGLYNIDHPGLYYDEALFVNAATGGETDLFVFRRIADIPVMLMPYIGALKAWLYYPIFKLFGIDYLSIRLPALLFGALAIGLTWKYVLHQFGSIAAGIFLLMAVVEPSTIFHSRLDWGPTALMMVFRGGLLLSLAYWFYSGKSKYLLLALSCAALGTFDKLNFIWIASAAFVAGIIVYPNRFGVLAILKKKATLVSTIFVLVLIFVISVKFLGIQIFKEISFADLGSRLSVFCNLATLTFRGEGVYAFVIQNGSTVFYLHFYVLLATSLVSLWGIYSGIRDNRLAARPLVFLALTTLFLGIQILITKKATGPHHFATLAPLWLIFIAVGMAGALGSIQKRSVLIARASIGFFIILVVFTSMKINLLYHEDLKTKIINLNWDPAASSELTKTLIAHGVKSIVAIDWGLATNVQALSNNQIKVIDLWPMFNDALNQAQVAWIQSEFIDKEAVFVLTVEGKEVFPAARRNFVATAHDNDWTLQRSLVINSRSGRPYIEVFWLARK